MAAAETDDQLRRALEEKGIHVGPVTDTTRELYREKLRRLTGDTVGQGTRKGIAKGSPRQHLSHSQEVDGGKPTGLPPPPTANTSSSCKYAYCFPRVRLIIYYLRPRNRRGLPPLRTVQQPAPHCNRHGVLVSSGSRDLCQQGCPCNSLRYPLSIPVQPGR